jgi:hypothetical protein
MRECQLSETTNLRCVMASPLRNVLVSHVWAAKRVKLGHTRHHYSGIRMVKASSFCRLCPVLQEGLPFVRAVSGEGLQRTRHGPAQRHLHVPPGGDEPFSPAADGGGGPPQRYAAAGELYRAGLCPLPVDPNVGRGANAGWPGQVPYGPQADADGPQSEASTPRWAASSPTRANGTGRN